MWMEDLAERMNAQPADGDEGTLQATLSQMTDAELEECADEMAHIAVELIERHSEVHPYHTAE